MKIIINNRFTDKVMMEAEGKNLKEVVVANKANLWGAEIKITQKEELLKSIGIKIE